MLALAIATTFATAALLAVAAIGWTVRSHGGAVLALFAEARAEKRSVAYSVEPKEAAGDIAATLMPVIRIRPLDAAQVVGRLPAASLRPLPLRAAA